jgi:hypothetical protein
MYKSRFTTFRGLLIALCVNLTIVVSFNAAYATEVFESGPIFAGGETVPPEGPFAIAITFRTVDPANGDSSSFCLFYGLILNDSDVGRTFYADETNDPAFLDVVRVLTNGRLDEVGATNGEPVPLRACPALGRGSAGPENVVFAWRLISLGSRLKGLDSVLKSLFCRGFQAVISRAPCSSKALAIRFCAHQKFRLILSPIAFRIVLT